MKSPPIHCWVEPVDHQVVAVHAKCEVVRSSAVYGIAVFVLVDSMEAYGWRTDGGGYQGHYLAKNKLREVVANGHAGSLPYVCHSGERRGIA